jgi:hypothetical protein
VNIPVLCIPGCKLHPGLGLGDQLEREKKKRDEMTGTSPPPAKRAARRAVDEEDDSASAGRESPSKDQKRKFFRLFLSLFALPLFLARDSALDTIVSGCNSLCLEVGDD